MNAVPIPTVASDPDKTGVVARTYQLHIEVIAPVRVVVGRLGTFDFPAGRYVYTGSARQNLEARIRRHLGSAKKNHWHIDYLLAAKGVRISRVERFIQSECVVNKRTPGRIIASDFGSSDCRARCSSHLKWQGMAPFS